MLRHLPSVWPCTRNSFFLSFCAWFFKRGRLSTKFFGTLGKLCGPLHTGHVSINTLDFYILLQFRPWRNNILKKKTMQLSLSRNLVDSLLQILFRDQLEIWRFCGMEWYNSSVFVANYTVWHANILDNTDSLLVQLCWSLHTGHVSTNTLELDTSPVVNNKKIVQWSVVQMAQVDHPQLFSNGKHENIWNVELSSLLTQYLQVDMQ